MSVRDTLARILTILNGETPPPPPVDVTNDNPEYMDSRALLALKWEQVLKDRLGQ
jgi:hypothetical protein